MPSSLWHLFGLTAGVMLLERLEKNGGSKLPKKKNQSAFTPKKMTIIGAGLCKHSDCERHQGLTNGGKPIVWERETLSDSDCD